ncbi:leucine-rich repeat and immunoglobulin-like domain-containing nogo receptor-interacting protein 1 [Trichomycterus rosablanca]|uniref:leucine-rich repeat and immunoglobulin-like domain-containing nogo receptor-interacting protein 1 n=1 Tax=Trichomycterus rosablanca TaxID=2290929 RepID=UPI002F355DFE
MYVEAECRLVYWWVVHLWIVVLSDIGDPSSLCPQPCKCIPNLLMVNCSSRQLSSVPKGMNMSTQNLNLANNLLKTLGQGQFSDLAQLQELDLSENLLSVIEVEAFVGLHNLITLRISKNRLKIILVGVFSGLQTLRLLDISRNEILVLLNDMFIEMPSLQKLEASRNDLVFVSKRAFNGLQSLKELHLDGYNLTSIPSEALSQLTSLARLYFCHTGLTVLPSDSFRQLSQLSELTVSHWPWLYSLDPNSLIGLNLTLLILSYCNLNSVPYASLWHLDYLQYLDLSYNPITFIQPDMLKDLVRLRELHLVGGNLLRVEPGAFRGLANLQLLNVSYNQLSSLEETVFHSIRTLRVLRLDGNPLVCDCRLFWVLHRRRQLDFNGQPPSCNSPVQARGRRFLDFTEPELIGLFICRQARILNRKPQEVRADEGQTILFFCQVDGDPAPSVIWVSPRRIVLPNTGRIHVLADGTLEVRYAQVQDSGHYHCFASNVAGNDSISVSLWVHNLPSVSTRNRTSRFLIKAWRLASTHPPINGSEDSQPFAFDMKTLLVAVTMGFLSFLSSVAVCFVFMLFWSQSKGQIKHTATIDFVPHSAGEGSGGGRTRMETGRFTMKLI